MAHLLATWTSVRRPIRLKLIAADQPSHVPFKSHKVFVAGYAGIGRDCRPPRTVFEQPGFIPAKN